MRFMVIMNADEQAEAGVLPSEEFLAAMQEYQDELRKAGVLLYEAALHPSSKGVKVHFAGGKTSVTDGPFTETKELIAGFWLIEVSSREEAIEWVKRIPVPPDGDTSEGTVVIRQVFEPEDFGDAVSAEIKDGYQPLRNYLEDES